MLEKWYELSCDYCGGAINHYPDRKPSKELLKKDCAVVSGDKHFCTQGCYEQYKKQKYGNREDL